MNQIVEYYDEIAPSYDEDRFNNTYGRFIDTQERKILEQLLSDQELIIMDLACGSGRLLRYAGIGLDASTEMLQLAKNKFPEKIILQAEADKIPMRPESLDVIFSFHFFMHLDRPEIEKILAEVHRVLKEKGRLIFDIPSGKRRKLLGYTGRSWHGAYSSGVHGIKEMGHDLFVVKRTFGLLILPVHRFPKSIRKWILGLDYYLANSLLKEYSSYLIIELEKK